MPGRALRRQRDREQSGQSDGKKRFARFGRTVVSVGHLIQTQPVWKYLRETVEPETAQALAKARVQPLQILDIADYEKLLGIAEASTSLPTMLRHKAAGPFRERDFAAWLHGDKAAPSDAPRVSALKHRWDAMSIQISAQTNSPQQLEIPRRHSHTLTRCPEWMDPLGGPNAVATDEDGVSGRAREHSCSLVQAGVSRSSASAPGTRPTQSSRPRR